MQPRYEHLWRSVLRVVRMRAYAELLCAATLVDSHAGVRDGMHLAIWNIYPVRYCVVCHEQTNADGMCDYESYRWLTDALGMLTLRCNAMKDAFICHSSRHAHIL
jgi:hypothetical protein